MPAKFEFAAPFTSVGNFFQKLLSIPLYLPFLLLAGGVMLFIGITRFTYSILGCIFLLSGAQDTLSKSIEQLYGGIALLIAALVTPFINLVDFLGSCCTSIAKLFKTSSISPQQDKNATMQNPTNNLQDQTAKPLPKAPSSYSTTPLFTPAPLQAVQGEPAANLNPNN